MGLKSGFCNKWIMKLKIELHKFEAWLQISEITLKAASVTCTNQLETSNYCSS